MALRKPVSPCLVFSYYKPPSALPSVQIVNGNLKFGYEVVTVRLNIALVGCGTHESSGYDENEL